MISGLDALGMISAALPWMQRIQMRRLERLGADVSFAPLTRGAIERSGVIATELGDRAIAPVHLSMAVLELAEHSGAGAAVPLALPPADATAERPAPSQPFEYSGFVVLAESCRIANAEHGHEVTPRHLLMSVLRKRTSAASRLLAERGITLERLVREAHGAKAQQ